MLTLAKRLVQEGVSVQTVIPYSAAQSEIVRASLSWYERNGVVAETNPAFSRENQGWRNVWHLMRFLRTCPAKVVNIHYTENVGVSLTDVLAARLAGKRCMINIQHPTPWRMTTPRKQKAIGLALRLAHGIGVSTPFTQRLLMEILPASQKVDVLPPGLPPPDTVPDRDAARAAWGIPSDAFVVGTLSRLVAYKGVDDTLRALAMLPDPEARLRFLVAGDGPARAEFEMLARETLGARAIFLGRVDDARQLYAASDVFAMPSHMEGFGLVYVEAAFQNVPSIGCAVGGVPYVIDDGKTGLLVPPGDTDALARAIETLRTDYILRLRMGDAARQRALVDFTDAAMAAAYKKVLFD